MDDRQPWSMKDIIDKVHAQHSNTGMLVVGVVGPPAAGKSTFAEDLRRGLNRCSRDTIAQLCPMDGFHFSNVKLDQLGLRKFKGRIDTFDVERYVSFIRRLRQGEREFYWPVYSRERHDVVADGIWINRDSTIFVTEGNYLLSGVGYWAEVLDLIDLKIYLEAGERAIEERLRRRHLEGGKTLVQAEEKIIETDLPNATFIAKSRSAADIVLRERRAGDFEYWHRLTDESDNEESCGPQLTPFV
jgi:pantothenate kinase